MTARGIVPSRACCLRLDLPRGMSASSGSLCSLALDTSHTLLWSWCDNPLSVRWCLALDPRLKLRLTAEGLGAGLWRWSERTAVPIPYSKSLPHIYSRWTTRIASADLSAEMA